MIICSLQPKPTTFVLWHTFPACATLLLRLVLALAGFAHAGAMRSGNSQNLRKAKKGTLNITVATEIGGVTLEPGEYEVKQVNSKNGPILRFAHYTFDPDALGESSSEYVWEVVAEVRVTVQPLDSAAERTRLVVDSNRHKAIGLKIRGNSVDYLFAAA